LEPTSEHRDPSTALMDGSVGVTGWFYAVGSYAIWHGGIPMMLSSDVANFVPATQVELYIRYDPTQEVNTYETIADHRGCDHSDASVDNGGSVLGTVATLLSGATACTTGGNECVELGKEACDLFGDVCWGFTVASNEDVKIHTSDAMQYGQCTSGTMGLTPASGWTTYVRSSSGVKTYDTEVGRCTDFEGSTFDYLEGTQNTICNSICNVNDDCRGYEIHSDGTCRVLFEILPSETLGMTSLSTGSGTGRAIAANGDAAATCYKIIPDDMCTSDTIYARECYSYLMETFYINGASVGNDDLNDNSNGALIEFYVQCSTATTLEYEVELYTPDYTANSFWMSLDNGDYERWNTGRYNWGYGKGPTFDITDTNVHTLTFHAREDGLAMRRISMLSSDCQWVDPSTVTPATYSFGTFHNACRTGYVEITDATECSTASAALNGLTFDNTITCGGGNCVCKGQYCRKQVCQYAIYSEIEGTKTEFDYDRYICKLDSSTEVEVASELSFESPQHKATEIEVASESVVSLKNPQHKQSSGWSEHALVGVTFVGIFSVAVYIYHKTIEGSSYELIKFEEEEV